VPILTDFEAIRAEIMLICLLVCRMQDLESEEEDGGNQPKPKPKKLTKKYVIRVVFYTIRAAMK